MWYGFHAMLEVLDIIQFPMFEDNYGYLLKDRVSGRVTTIDPGEAPRVVDALESRGWKLDEIWNTHHHADHVGGNLALKARYGCRISGPAAEAAKIPGIDVLLKEGDRVALGEISAIVLDVGGHTLGHIAFYIADQKALFLGDTVFGLGCGRLFEGTPSQMWASLSKIQALPDDTRLFCAHEYLEANIGFALASDPLNGKLRTRIEGARALRARGLPTVPLFLEEEKNTNPFFRASDEAYRQNFFPGKDALETFAELRSRRNIWKA